MGSPNPLDSSLYKLPSRALKILDYMQQNPSASFYPRDLAQHPSINETSPYVYQYLKKFLDYSLIIKEHGLYRINPQNINNRTPYIQAAIERQSLTDAIDNSSGFWDLFCDLFNKHIPVTLHGINIESPPIKAIDFNAIHWARDQKGNRAKRIHISELDELGDTNIALFENTTKAPFLPTIAVYYSGVSHKTLNMAEFLYWEFVVEEILKRDIAPLSLSKMVWRQAALGKDIDSPVLFPKLNLKHKLIKNSILELYSLMDAENRPKVRCAIHFNYDSALPRSDYSPTTTTTTNATPPVMPNSPVGVWQLFSGIANGQNLLSQFDQSLEAMNKVSVNTQQNSKYLMSIDATYKEMVNRFCQLATKHVESEEKIEAIEKNIEALGNLLKSAKPASSTPDFTSLTEGISENIEDLREYLDQQLANTSNALLRKTQSSIDQAILQFGESAIESITPKIDTIATNLESAIQQIATISTDFDQIRLITLQNAAVQADISELLKQQSARDERVETIATDNFTSQMEINNRLIDLMFSIDKKLDPPPSNTRQTSGWAKMKAWVHRIRGRPPP